MTQVIDPEYRKLQIDFNNAMENLENTITVISDSIGIVGNGANEIATASNDLAKRTEMQAPNLEETSATLGQITMIISRSAGSAKEASEAATTVRMDTAKSSLIVNDGVAAMERIKDTAKAISQIMGMIDEIAFQTNIFAFNAGVEAARAGDSGRGFAVVATKRQEAEKLQFILQLDGATRKFPFI